jgi:hypothetical protein
VVTFIGELLNATCQVLVSKENSLEYPQSSVTHSGKPPIDEVAVFTATTDPFSMADKNGAWRALSKVPWIKTSEHVGMSVS